MLCCCILSSPYYWPEGFPRGQVGGEGRRGVPRHEHQHDQAARRVRTDGRRPPRRDLEERRGHRLVPVDEDGHGRPAHRYRELSGPHQAEFRDRNESKAGLASSDVFCQISQFVLMFFRLVLQILTDLW